VRCRALEAELRAVRAELAALQAGGKKHTAVASAEHAQPEAAITSVHTSAQAAARACASRRKFKAVFTVVRAAARWPTSCRTGPASRHRSPTRATLLVNHYLVRTLLATAACGTGTATAASGCAPGSCRAARATARAGRRCASIRTLVPAWCGLSAGTAVCVRRVCLPGVKCGVYAYVHHASFMLNKHTHTHAPPSTNYDASPKDPPQLAAPCPPSDFRLRLFCRFAYR
jgi:hypothetical protein